MFKRISFFAVCAFTALTASAQASADFYGVQMKSEDFAHGIPFIETNKISDFSNGRPGMDKRIYAYGYMGRVVDSVHGFSVEVFNRSDKTLATKKLFRGLTIVTNDGRRYDRGHTETMWSRDEIKPGEQATFNFKFRGIRVGREELRMVICSFDLDGTQIFLLPLKEPGSPAPVHAASDEEMKVMALALDNAETAAMALALDKAEKTARPVPVVTKSAQAVERREEVRPAQKSVVSVVPSREVKVIQVNLKYGFVVVDAGLEGGFGKNTILDVTRNGHRIGKVMITKPRDKISGAIILPEWRTRDEIGVGDIVGVSA